ncbi:MAG: phosphate acyltransferase PlsX [Candidatus Krumholzibacteria bacterium]|nr:phosphate acyltransferase PlsX [Candidatus Krumholzibacteria bacterium]
MTNRAKPVIAVDVMGGDHGPEVVVPGALAALPADFPFDLHLYGAPDAVEAELAKHGSAGLPVAVIPCTQDIEMGESPASAIRSKKDSPIVRAMIDQKAGQVQAVVSAGSTGAMVAASLIILGRIPGVDRPAIGTVIPTVKGELLLLDAGANVQCTADHLVSFARMGNVFAREMMGLATPAIGQLNIGGEPKKGTELNVETFKLLEKSDLNFVGNIEGNQLMLGPCDVVVTDGYTGNNTLKLVEGFARFMGALSKRPDLTAEEQAAFGPILQFLGKNFSYEVKGGAMLLGVSGVSIIAHGRSSVGAISNAVKEAWNQVRKDLPAKLAAGSQ